MRYNSGVCLSKTNIIKAGKDLFLYHRGKKRVTLMEQKTIESNVKFLKERNLKEVKCATEIWRKWEVTERN